MKQSGSEIDVFKLIFEHGKDTLNTDFKYVGLLYLSIHMFNIAITFADANKFY